jgi:tetratricopeptide (TPR) repeat protein
MSRSLQILAAVALLGAAVGCAGSEPAKAKDARALVEKGKAAALSGDQRTALSFYSAAVAEDPELAEAYYERGKSNVFLRLSPGESDNARVFEQRALDDFTAAVDKNSGYAEAYFNRAMILASRAQYKLAVEDFLCAARYAPSDPEPHRWLGDLYEHKFEDRAPTAMEHFQRYLDLGGRDADIRDKVRTWKELNKLASAVLHPPAKAPTPEEELKAGELHAHAMELLAQQDKTEGLKVLETLVTEYGHTKYVQEKMSALQALLKAFGKQRGAPK